MQHSKGQGRDQRPHAQFPVHLHQASDSAPWADREAAPETETNLRWGLGVPKQSFKKQNKLEPNETPPAINPRENRALPANQDHSEYELGAAHQADQ